MSRINLWSRSLPRIELDQRSRDARLRLQHLERLLVSHARTAVSAPLASVRGPLSDQRPSAIGFGGSRIVAQLR